MDKKRIYEYDILRVFVLFLVLIGHSTYLCLLTKYGGINYQVDNTAIPFANEKLSHMVEMIYYFHMPLFMALSGALAHNALRKKFQVLVYDKSKRLLIPFIFVTLFYSTPIKFFTGYYNGFGKKETIKSIIIGQLFIQGNSHLWFILTLFFIFLVMFFLVKIKNKRIIFTLLLLSNYFSSYCEIMLIKYIMENLLWFYIGYLFYDIREVYNKFILEHKISNSILPILIFLVLRRGRYLFQNNCLLSLFIFKLVVAILGMIICYNLAVFFSQKYSIQNNKIFDLLLKNSYGMYLYSDPINYAILFLFSILFGNMFFYSNKGFSIMFIFRLIMTTIVGLVVFILVRRIGGKKING